jgi:hypothetical protein
MRLCLKTTLHFRATLSSTSSNAPTNYKISRDRWGSRTSSLDGTHCLWLVFWRLRGKKELELS